MRRFLLILIASVVVGKIFAVAVTKFAENSDFNSKTLVHRLFLDKMNTDEHLKVTNIPNNLGIIKENRNSRFLRQILPTQPKIKLPLTAAKFQKIDEKAVEEKTKEDERRKKRLKDLEEKTDAVAAKEKTTIPTHPLYYPPAPTSDYTPPTYYTAYPLPVKTPVPVSAAGVPLTSPGTTGIGGGSKSSNKNISSWTSLLVNTPSASLIGAFEALYKTNQISESDFYSVLDAMKASTNSEARYFSVQAAALYQNISSFKILADESQAESNGEIKNYAQSAIRAYAVAADISILNQALASGDPYEVLEARSLMPTTAATQAVQNQASSEMARN